MSQIRNDAKIKCIELVNEQKHHEVYADAVNTILQKYGADRLTAIINKFLEEKRNYFDVIADGDRALIRLFNEIELRTRPYLGLGDSKRDYVLPGGGHNSTTVIEFRNLVMGMCLDYVWDRGKSVAPANVSEPPHHLDRAIAEQNAYYNKPTIKDTAMTIKIETRTFLNGDDASKQSDDFLFSKIAEAEKEVERLEAIKTKPKKLQAKIDELKQGIEALSAYIDAR